MSYKMRLPFALKTLFSQMEDATDPVKKLSLRDLYNKIQQLTDKWDMDVYKTLKISFNLTTISEKIHLIQITGLAYPTRVS